MSKISVGPSAIIISDYEKGSCRRLESQFEVCDPFFNKSELGMHYDSENKKLYITRNYNIQTLEYYFGKRVHYDITPNHSKHVDIKLRVPPRDDEQKTALRFMIGIGEFIDCAKKTQLGLYLNTGKGKTYSMIAATSYYGKPTIIITSSTDWLRQWKGEILNFTDTKETEICMINGSPKIKYFLNHPSKAEKYKYFLITHSLIETYAKEVGWDNLNDLFKILGVGIKVFDEAHLNFANLCKIDFYTRVAKTYYITATPTKSSDGEKIVYGNYFKNMRCITLFRPDEDPHTDYRALLFSSNIMPWEISEFRTAYGLNRSAYCNWLVNNEQFKKLLYIIMGIAINRGKTLMYIATLESINIVKKWIELNFPEFIGRIGVYTSDKPAHTKAAELNNPIILSTTKSFGAAVDCKGLKMTVNLAEPFKSEVLARQSLGRTRDSGTMYLDVVDTAVKDTRRYYHEKLPIFRKYALTVGEIPISSAELDIRYQAYYNERNNPVMPEFIWNEPICAYRLMEEEYQPQQAFSYNENYEYKAIEAFKRI